MGFFDQLFSSNKPAKPDAVVVAAEKGAVYSPASGRVEQAPDLPDPVFAAGFMGPCLGVWPTDGHVFAPLSGTITASMPHAFAFRGDDGIEVLLHVGVDTVEMKGDGFTIHVKKGEHVEVGEPLLTFDREKVAKAGYCDIVMTVITNADCFACVNPVADGEVTVGTKLFQVE